MSQSDAVSAETESSGASGASAGSATSDPKADPALARLQAQLDWYDRHAGRSQRWFTVFKVLSLIAAAAIPILSGFGERWVTLDVTLTVGLLGAAIVVIEGLLRLFQWEQHWLRYRATWLALDREKALYLSTAGAYADSENPRRLLAERIEELMTQENMSWVSLHEERKGKDSAS